MWLALCIAIDRDARVFGHGVMITIRTRVLPSALMYIDLCVMKND
jgi:hypothetical protein